MNLLDLLFPPRCAGCRRHGSNWCAACASSIQPIESVEIAGVPVIAGGWFGGVLQAAIHTYKYRGRPALARPLVSHLLDAIQRAELRLEALTFVPLHEERQRRRGFNQAERLARLLGAQLDVPLLGGLVRSRATPAQVGLSQAQRRQNVAGAFTWLGALPPSSGLGLVDDVCTTGATLEAAAEVIRAAGGSVAAFLVVARAQTLPQAAVALPEQSACS